MFLHCSINLGSKWILDYIFFIPNCISLYKIFFLTNFQNYFLKMTYYTKVLILNDLIQKAYTLKRKNTKKMWRKNSIPIKYVHIKYSLKIGETKIMSNRKTFKRIFFSSWKGFLPKVPTLALFFREKNPKKSFSHAVLLWSYFIITCLQLEQNELVYMD